MSSSAPAPMSLDEWRAKRQGGGMSLEAWRAARGTPAAPETPTPEVQPDPSSDLVQPSAFEPHLGPMTREQAQRHEDAQTLATGYYPPNFLMREGTSHLQIPWRERYEAAMERSGSKTPGFEKYLGARAEQGMTKDPRIAARWPDRFGTKPRSTSRREDVEGAYADASMLQKIGLAVPFAAARMGVAIEEGMEAQRGGVNVDAAIWAGFRAAGQGAMAVAPGLASGLEVPGVKQTAETVIGKPTEYLAEGAYDLTGSEGVREAVANLAPVVIGGAIAKGAPPVIRGGLRRFADERVSRALAPETPSLPGAPAPVRGSAATGAALEVPAAEPMQTARVPGPPPRPVPTLQPQPVAEAVQSSLGKELPNLTRREVSKFAGEAAADPTKLRTALPTRTQGAVEGAAADALAEPMAKMLPNDVIRAAQKAGFRDPLDAHLAILQGDQAAAQFFTPQQRAAIARAYEAATKTRAVVPPEAPLPEAKMPRLSQEPPSPQPARGTPRATEPPPPPGVAGTATGEAAGAARYQPGTEPLGMSRSGEYGGIGSRPKMSGGGSSLSWPPALPDKPPGVMRRFSLARTTKAIEADPVSGPELAKRIQASNAERRARSGTYLEEKADLERAHGTGWDAKLRDLVEGRVEPQTPGEAQARDLFRRHARELSSEFTEAGGRMQDPRRAADIMGKIDASRETGMEPRFTSAEQETIRGWEQDYGKHVVDQVMAGDEAARAKLDMRRVPQEWEGYFGQDLRPEIRDLLRKKDPGVIRQLEAENAGNPDAVSEFLRSFEDDRLRNRNPGLEKPRQVRYPKEWLEPSGSRVWDSMIRRNTRSTAEQRAFRYTDPAKGKARGAKGQGDLGDLVDRSRDPKFMRDKTQQALDREPIESGADALLAKANRAEGLVTAGRLFGGNLKSAAVQATQAVNTVTTTGPWNYVKAFKNAAMKAAEKNPFEAPPKNAAAGLWRKFRDSRLTGAGFRQAAKESRRAGAIQPESFKASQGLDEAPTSKFGRGATKAVDVVTTPIRAADTFFRVLNDEATQVWLDQARKDLSQGNRRVHGYTEQVFKDLDLTPEQIAELQNEGPISKQTLDHVRQRTQALWQVEGTNADSPTMLSGRRSRILGRLKKFTIGKARSDLTFAWKPAARYFASAGREGSVAPLARLVAFSVVVGHAINSALNTAWPTSAPTWKQIMAEEDKEEAGRLAAARLWEDVKIAQPFGILFTLGKLPFADRPGQEMANLVTPPVADLAIGTAETGGSIVQDDVEDSPENVLEWLRANAPAVSQGMRLYAANLDSYAAAEEARKKSKKRRGLRVPRKGREVEYEQWIDRIGDDE